VTAIGGEEIIKPGYLKLGTKEAEELLKVYDKLDKKAIDLAKSIKGVTDAFKPGQGIISFNKITEVVKKSTKAQEAAIKVGKERQRLEERLKSLNSDSIQQNEELKVLLTQQRKINKELAREKLGLVGAYEKESKKLIALRTQYKNLALSEGESSKQAKNLLKTITALDSKLKKVDATVGQHGRSVGNYAAALGSAAQRAKGLLTAFGIVGGVQLFSRVIKDAFNIVKNFDQAQANLSSVMAITREQMAPLTAQAKLLGSTTEFTASAVSGLQLEFAKLGFTQSDIQNVTEATLSLASAAGTELARAAEVTGATIRGFGLATTETQRVVDVMAKSFSSSSLDMEKFATAMSAVAPVANAAGVNIERTTALLGTLTDRGIDASSAGTGLRNMFLSATQAGITFDEALAQVNSASDKTAKSLELFGKKGATLGVILAENGGDIDNLERALNNAGGAAEEMAEKQLDTLEGSLSILRSSWEGFILGADGASGASEKLKDVIKLLADNLPAVLDTLLAIVGAFVAFKAIKGAIALFKGFTAVIKGVRVAMIGLNVVMALNPIGLMVVAIGLAVAAFVIFRKEIGEFIDKAIELLTTWEGIKTILLAIIAPMLAVAGALDEQKEETKELTAEQQRLNKVNSEALKQGKKILDQKREEIARTQVLLDALRSENTSREDRNKIIDELNRKYPELLENIDLETANTRELAEVRRLLTKQILANAIEEEKAAAKKELFNRAIKKQVDFIITGNKQLEKESKRLLASITLVDEIAATVFNNLDSVVDGLDLGKPLRELDEDIDAIERRIATGKVVGAELEELQKRLDALLKQRAEILGFGLEGGAAEEFDENEKKKTTSLIAELRKRKVAFATLGPDAKIQPEDLQADFDQFVRAQQNETLALEIALRKRGASAEEIRKALADKELEDLKSRRDKVAELFGENNAIFLAADLEVRREIDRRNDEQEKAEDQRLEDEKKRNQKRIDLLKKQAEERQKDQKKMLQDSLKFFQDVTKGLEKNIDNRIAAQQREIDASETRIAGLQARADAGSLNAQESIKAEEIRLAKANTEIADLEKKKNRLLALTAFLQLSNLLLEAGDSNAFKKASDEMNTGVNSLPTFFEGTDTTIADALGATGTRDGHTVRVHDNEHIVGSKDSDRLHDAGLWKTSDIVDSAIAHQDKAFMGGLVGEKPVDKMGILTGEVKGMRQELKDMPKNMPKYDWEWDPIEQAIIFTTTTQNKEEKKHFNVGGAFS